MGPTWDLRGLAQGAHSNPTVWGCTRDMGFPRATMGMGHGPIDLTTGQQWAGLGGAHVGFKWDSPSPRKTHGPTVAHGNPRRDLDGLAICDNALGSVRPFVCQCVRPLLLGGLGHFFLPVLLLSYYLHHCYLASRLRSGSRSRVGVKVKGPGQGQRSMSISGATSRRY